MPDRELAGKAYRDTTHLSVRGIDELSVCFWNSRTIRTTRARHVGPSFLRFFLHRSKQLARDSPLPSASIRSRLPTAETRIHRPKLQLQTRHVRGPFSIKSIAVSCPLSGKSLVANSIRMPDLSEVKS